MFLQQYHQQIELLQFKDLLNIYIPLPVCVLTPKSEQDLESPKKSSEINVKNQTSYNSSKLEAVFTNSYCLQDFGLEQGQEIMNILYQTKIKLEDLEKPSFNIFKFKNKQEDNRISNNENAIKESNLDSFNKKKSNCCSNNNKIIDSTNIKIIDNTCDKFNENDNINAIGESKLFINPQKISNSLQAEEKLPNLQSTIDDSSQKISLYDYLQKRLLIHQNSNQITQSLVQQIYNCKVCTKKHQNFDQDHDKDNDDKIYDIKLLTMYWNNQSSLLLIFNNVSSKYREVQNKQLDNYKAKILESVSHNLKTPLHGIRLYIDMLLVDNLFRNCEELACIDIEAQILKSQIDQILDFSTIEKGERLELDCQEFYIPHTLQHLKLLFYRQISFKNIEVQIRYERDLLDQSIFNDQIRLENVLIDLMQNAIKYCNKGQIILMVINVPNQSHLLQVQIINTGKVTSPTIKSRNLSKSFMKSQLFKESLEFKKSENIGFTLQICQLLINQIGPTQELLVKRGANNQTVISFYIYKYYSNTLCQKERYISLDRKFEDQLEYDTQLYKTKLLDEINSFPEIDGLDELNNNHCIQSVPQFTPISTLSKVSDSCSTINWGKKVEISREKSDLLIHKEIKALIIDDNVFNIMSLSALLGRIPSVKLIDKLYNGKECLDRINKIIQNKQIDKHYNIIFMDINMPIMDGFEASQELIRMKNDGAINWQMKIVLLSAFTNPHDKEIALQIGCNEYHSKPLGFQQIQRILQQVDN